MTDNSEQAELWNGRMGNAWVSVEDYIDRMLEPLSNVAIDTVAASTGQRIIDVGCGCGTTSAALASSGARVWGVDISRAMIDRAKEKYTAHSSLQFSVGDAAEHSYTADHDAAFSRFGVMFFADPVAAFANIRTALVPGGKLVFLCWQTPAENPWIAVAGAALQPFQPPDAPAPDPLAPGPFSLADPQRTTDILTRAGFSDIDVTPVVRELSLGTSVDEVMAFQTRVGPLSGLLEELDEETGRAAREAVRQAFLQYLGQDGVRMQASTWLVSAR